MEREKKQGSLEPIFMTTKIRKARNLIARSDYPEKGTSAPHVPRLQRRTVRSDLKTAVRLLHNGLMSTWGNGGEGEMRMRNCSQLEECLEAITHLCG